jgi:hypothetical protein
MSFLTDEWLCDVQTDYIGKCVLIAFALTVLERAELDDRPAFWVTAGKRGGGKTTAINMVVTALTGERAAAAAWSPGEEERRKAIFALLLQRPPFVIFDNIPRGVMISCPTIEKVCTSTHLDDRCLGKSEYQRASCSTVMAFTGNNCEPKGDLASRSLIARISVDRPDPENREFKHPDPLKWTLEHRGQILAALYTVMLGNPRHRGKAKTRFKAWWLLIGSAVEHAATLSQSETAVHFDHLFAEVESKDEDGTSTLEMLKALRAIWRDAEFKASEVLSKVSGSIYAEPSDEGDAALVLFFCVGKATPSAKAICMKLQNCVDEPVFLNGSKILTPKARKDHSRTWWFWVEGKDLGGEV